MSLELRHYRDGKQTTVVARTWQPTWVGFAPFATIRIEHLQTKTPDQEPENRLRCLIDAHNEADLVEEPSSLQDHSILLTSGISHQRHQTQTLQAELGAGSGQIYALWFELRGKRPEKFPASSDWHLQERGLVESCTNGTEGYALVVVAKAKPRDS